MLFSRCLHSPRESAREDRVIVIGSGPAAAAATVFLTDAGVEVTLLEAGSASRARGMTARIGGVTVMRLHRALKTRTSGVRAAGDPGTLLYEDIAPGGLTNHWSCAVPRFSPDDFLDGRRAGEAHTWPVEYEDLAPWYDRVEPLLRVSGTTEDAPQLPAGRVFKAQTLSGQWRDIADLAARDGQAVVPVPYVYGGQTTLTFSGTVFNSFVRLVKPALRTRRLTVHFDTRATQLEWSSAARRVTAVIARDMRTGTEQRFPCRAVVVAAGSINTTKLLLQSTSSDFPQGLGNTDGVLGRYLHDHPVGKVMLDLSAPLPFSPAAYVTRLPLEQTEPLYSASCLQWSGVYGLVRSIWQGHPWRLASTGFSVFGTMAPALENSVSLDSSVSSDDGTPGLVLDIRYPRESTLALEAARDRIVHLLEEAKLRPRVSAWLIDPVGSAIHYAGSCRMHASPRYGVLDAWSRMHAVRNVVVADSAAFTTGSEKNPVLTAMALAARGCARLIADLRSDAV